MDTVCRGLLSARFRTFCRVPFDEAQAPRGMSRGGCLAAGFARFRCAARRHDQLVAFSRKGRGFCPSCGGRRMTERAAHLVDYVFPDVPDAINPAHAGDRRSAVRCVDRPLLVCFAVVGVLDYTASGRCGSEIRPQ